MNRINVSNNGSAYIIYNDYMFSCGLDNAPSKIILYLTNTRLGTLDRRGSSVANPTDRTI
jgi:hypothetical protein